MNQLWNQNVIQFSLSVMSNSVTPWTAALQASLSITNSRSLLKLMSIKAVMPSSHLILCRPLLLLPSIFPSISIFSEESVLCISGQRIGVSASASVLPMNIQDSFPLGWTKWIFCCPRDSQESSPTPQFKSINSSVLRFLYSPTLISTHDYYIDLTRWTFVGKVTSLLLSMLSRMVITFLPRSKHLLISGL